tara:strand:- start:870 stop:1187 length:318 start_codon:yes stop_codon:yes gene_type:complete
MSKKVIYSVYAAIILFGVAPILSVLFASGIASVGGCALNEGSTNACSVVGIELGGMLYIMFVAGWFALMTLPLAFGALILWSIILLIRFFVLRSRKKREEGETAE